MEALRKYLWIVVGGFALGLLGVGAFLVYAGFDAKAEVKAMLVEEQVFTTAGTEQWGVAPGTLVQDAKTARAQANIIKEHTLGKYGPFAQVPRDQTDIRQAFFNGTGLRAALGLAEMGFGVANLAIALGAFAIVMGVAFTGLTAAAIVWALTAHPKAAPAARPEFRPARANA